MKITVAMLEDHCACPEQLALFKQIFGDEVEVTEARCRRYGELFDLDWAAHNFLSSSARFEFNWLVEPARGERSRLRCAAWTAYSKIQVAARDTYKDAKWGVWAAFHNRQNAYALSRSREPSKLQTTRDEALELAEAEYARTVAAARAEYDSIREAARVEYRKAAALAFYAVSKGVTVSISAIQTEIIQPSGGES